MIAHYMANFRENRLRNCKESCAKLLIIATVKEKNQNWGLADAERSRLFTIRVGVHI